MSETGFKKFDLYFRVDSGTGEENTHEAYLNALFINAKELSRKEGKPNKLSFTKHSLIKINLKPGKKLP